MPYVSKTDKKEIDRVFQRLFRTEDGQKAVAYLQYITFHRSLSASSTEEQLRHHEGERSLVGKIIRLANL